MARYSRVFMAAALLAAILACGDDDDEGVTSSGTCSPTAHTEPDPAGAAGFCAAFTGALCDRGFSDCAAVLGPIVGFWPNAEACRADLAAGCASEDFSNSWYDRPCGEACVAYAASAPCSAFEGSEPQACAAAMGSGPLACSGVIFPGTISDTITSGDPVFDGGHARAYCISFTAGHSVVIETLAPLSGTPMDDTVLHLLDPTGAQIAFNDDFNGLHSQIGPLTIPASGEHQIVVRGFSPFDVGSYQLRVTDTAP
jgi:hypothetical protein